MSLLEKKSLLDRPTLGNEGNVVGGGPGVRFFGNMKGNSSPFLPSRGQRPEYQNDHMVDLLENSVKSGNTGNIYSQPKSPRLDLDGNFPISGIYKNNGPADGHY